MSGSAKLPYGTLVLGTDGVKDAISGFDDAYVSIRSFEYSSACPRLDANPISKMNACPPNCLTPRKSKRSSPYTRTHNPSPRRPRWATFCCPPLGRLMRASKRPCRLPRWRRHRASRAWAGAFDAHLADVVAEQGAVPGTSPSTRRRSLESTISMIQEALDGT